MLLSARALSWRATIPQGPQVVGDDEAHAGRVGTGMPGFAVWLDGDDVGPAVPFQGRGGDVCPVVLPGADEVVKFGHGPGLLHVAEGGVGPAEESGPVGDQQVGRGGHAAVRVVHQLPGVVELPGDVATVCGHQVDELALGDKGRGPAGQEGGQAGGQGTAGSFSHGRFRGWCSAGCAGAAPGRGRASISGPGRRLGLWSRCR